MERSTECYLSRARLVEPLDGPTPLVLVSGPAGAGKSALLDAWCTQPHDSPICWIALEDDQPLFWQPVLQALGDHGLPVAPIVRRLAREPVLGDRLLADLVETLRASGRRWIVVVDGYELTSRPLADEVERLLGSAGDSVRLVLAARVDPVLRLYRHRLDASLTEIRAADLAFTDAEAAALLTRCGTPLPDDAVRTLNARMGGWATGLRFAADALARRTPDAGVAELPAADGDLTEYLLHEVLGRQDPETRRLLLHTCVPDSLTPELVDELVGPDGVRRLAGLVRSNLFLEPSGDEGTLRYHPFFRDLLRAQLAEEDPPTAARLHRQVAGWLRAHEDWEGASSQLAAGRLWEDLAEQLIDDLLVARLLIGEDGRLRTAARRIPAEVATPAANVVRAALALADTDIAGCAEHLGRAWVPARALHARSAACRLSYAVVAAVHAASGERLDVGEAAVLQAWRALTAARAPAVRLVSPEVEALLQVATARVALRRGEVDRALAALARVDALPGLPIRLRVGVLGHRALGHALAGRLSQADESGRESLELADDAHVAPDRRNPAAYAALALVALERDDLAVAGRHLGAARICRGMMTDPVSRAVGAGVLAHVEARAGAYRPLSEQGEIRDLWDDVDDPWLARWVRLQLAEVAVDHGHPEDALAALAPLAAGSGPLAELVTATAYAEQGRTVALGRTLARPLGDGASPACRVNRLLVEAVRTADRHSIRAAAPLVEQALAIASEEHLRRPFRAPPPTVRRVLAGHQELLDRQRWLSDDLLVPAPATAAPAARPAEARAARQSADPAGAPLEPLTPKELEVLGHLAELLSTEEIADQMYVSVNTVRTHVRSILRKLDVHRRNGAVRRARDLGLLAPSPGFAASITPQG